jgi:hypothetical protein
MLDGDRDELRSIRDELAFLRSASTHEQEPPRSQTQSTRVTMNRHPSAGPQKESIRKLSGRTTTQSTASAFDSSRDTESSSEKIARLQALKAELMDSQLYDPNDSVIQEIDNCIVQEQVILAEMRPYSRGAPEVK